MVKKELSEDDKARLQAIDEAITNGFRKAMQILTLQIQSFVQTPLRSRDLIIDEEEPQREIQTERRRKHRYNINKYKEVPHETVQVEPEQVVKDTYLSHPDLEVQKFIIDTIWRCVDSRKKDENLIFNSDNYIKLWALITQEEEKDIEVVMEEPLMRYNSCTSKKYKKKEIVRINDVLIKMSLQMLWIMFSITKTQVDLSHLVTLNTAQTITGTKSFNNQVTAKSFKEPEGANQQIMLANGINMNHYNFRPYYDAECVDGIRISRNLAKQTLDQDSSIYLGCSNTQESGAISGQWSITAIPQL
ncbi:MAG: hypothetical protein EZS28_006274 [Streblomastix strix]|uniref:Uncharacterized protein n=1 Tax=Streblomastix strix TaxID=222440 RepID=A0A5J4WV17_9EUKA|nr:MAG: hypothetical protein EZS28_006274 [Streblomastix strix]